MIWNDTWNVGVRQVDAQHQNLVSLLNQLHEARNQGKGADELGGILDKLVHYTQAHFSAEETLMEQAGYPDLIAHKRQHVLLAEKVVKFQATFKEGGCVLTGEIMKFLSTWLQTHICETDKKYVPYLHARGVR